MVMTVHDTHAPPMSANKLQALMKDPSTVMVNNRGMWYERYKWCKANLEDGTWNYNLGDWYFAKLEDAVLFKLRWS